MKDLTTFFGEDFVAISDLLPVVPVDAPKPHNRILSVV